MKTKRFYLASLLAVVCSLSAAPPAFAEQTSIAHLTSDDVNLPGSDFFRFYRSADKQEKEKARIYLLGVLDATEGKAGANTASYKPSLCRSLCSNSLINFPLRACTKGLPPD